MAVTRATLGPLELGRQMHSWSDVCLSRLIDPRHPIADEGENGWMKFRQIDALPMPPTCR
jgi:hypothetical protein